MERALFRWQKWRRSIISQWVEPYKKLEEMPPDQLKLEARQELQKLNLPVTILLELYWICSVTSDYNLDYPSSFDRIVIPDWLSLPPKPSPFVHFPKLKLGARIYPPHVMGEKDKEFFMYQHGLEAIDISYPSEDIFWIFLTAEHEFFYVLKQLKGHPKRCGKPGRVPSYSDRLAVQCTVLKDSGSTYVTIAKQLGLPVKKPYETLQSDSAKSLIQRGRKLIQASKIHPESANAHYRQS